MSKHILDLSVFADAQLDIKLPTLSDSDRAELDGVPLPDGGKLLRLIKPTQKMVIEMMKLKKLDEAADAETVINAMNRMCWMILSSNDEGIALDIRYIERGLSTLMKEALIYQYADFIKGVQSDPN